MTLNLRFLYLLPLLAMLFTNPALNAFLLGREDEAGGARLLEYALIGLSLLAVLTYYRYLEGYMRLWFWVVVGGALALSLESYAHWQSWVKYPHVFSKLTELLPLFGLYAFYRRFPPPSFGQLVAVLLPLLLLSLFIIYPEALSLSSFLTTERGFSVTSAYLLLPVALLCLNWYLTAHNFMYGLAFLLCLVLIVFLQHRTVWVCTAVALLVDVALVALRVPGARSWGSRLAVLAGLGLALGITSGLAVVLDNPDVMQKLAASIDDIQNPTTQGTGTFRMEQFRAYFPLVEERPLMGWRMEGFELPIQFFNADSGEPVWADFTGHHFHSFYLDRLFYFGGLGVLLVLVVPVVALGRHLLQRTPLPSSMAALLAFAVTFPVFGLSYDWPSYLYGLLGLLLAITSRPLPVLEPARRRPARKAVSLTSYAPAP
ncbi:O-antigen ligase family protein [Hymenobacter sp. BT683]|uniref:O-antigen ligase family protein n=1 Tax=Hymenobacter jeongseonensis TaxID=2791027 RepID=A0ABS0IE50_9BACT|nr:O-antigen ligase family protein [Hymenobacter jeongseonensis]MBF9236258.1 O-antigen ligase family protein [Hymenobacter jeongseonensis]